MNGNKNAIYNEVLKGIGNESEILLDEMTVNTEIFEILKKVNGECSTNENLAKVEYFNLGIIAGKRIERMKKGGQRCKE